jgi:hypothetical protein
MSDETKPCDPKIKKSIQSSLKRIDSDPLIQRIFKEAVETRAKFKIRFKDGQFFEGIIVGLSDTRVQFEFLLPHERNELHRKLKKTYWELGLPTPQSVFGLTLKNSNTYLFSGEIVSETLEKWSFAIPPYLQQVIRRKYFRYTIPKAYEIPVQIPNPRRAEIKITGFLVDLSRGGMAVKVPIYYEKEFVPGKSRFQVHFRLHGSEVIANVVVRSVRRGIPQNQETATSLIGLEFDSLSKNADAVISGYLDAKLLEIQSGRLGPFEG